MIRTTILCLTCFAIIHCTPTASTPESREESGTERKLVRIDYPESPEMFLEFTYGDGGDYTRVVHSRDTSYYMYHKDSLTIRWIDGLAGNRITDRCTLDDAGRVTYCTTTDQQGQQLSASGFTYSAEGYLDRYTLDNTRSGTVFMMQYVYHDGNLAEIRVQRNDESFDVFHYGYDQSIPNRLAFDVNHLTPYILANTRLGKVQPNLQTSMFRISVEGDTVSMRHYTYILDNEGYVTTLLESDPESGLQSGRVYTYAHPSAKN